MASPLTTSDRLQYIADAEGRAQAVVVPIDLWLSIRDRVEATTEEWPPPAMRERILESMRAPAEANVSFDEAMRRVGLTRRISMRSIEFTPIGFAEFAQWIAVDRKMAARIARLISDSATDPFHGIGKPEPLKGPLQGLWSRRIDQEHRLVYRVTDTHLTVLNCREHYG